MHLHGHLKDVSLNYGPVQEFWCFSFERYNGILGKQPTNNCAIEPQLLQQFLLDNFSGSYNFPDEFRKDFASLDLSNIQRSRISGSVMDTITKKDSLLPSKSKLCVLGLDDLEVLMKLYTKLHPEYSNITISNVYKKYSSVTLNGKVYRSSGLRNHARNSCKPYIVFVSWDQSYYGLPPTILPDAAAHLNSNERPVDVHHYVTVTCTLSNSREHDCHQSWTLARVSWFSPHPSRYMIGKPAELWCSTLFETFGMHSYVLLDHLLCT